MKTMNLTAIAFMAGLSVSTFSAGNAAAEMMEICSSAIRTYCPSVTVGRGRVTACLYAHQEKLAAGCRAEVETIAGRARLPDPAPAQSAGVKAACSREMTRHCGNVVGGDGKILACLYARSNTVSENCGDTIDLVLNQ